MVNPITVFGVLSITAMLGAFVLLLRRLGAHEVAHFIVALAVTAFVLAATGAVISL